MGLRRVPKPESVTEDSPYEWLTPEERARLKFQAWRQEQKPDPEPVKAQEEIEA